MKFLTRRYKISLLIKLVSSRSRLEVGRNLFEFAIEFFMLQRFHDRISLPCQRLKILTVESGNLSTTRHFCQMGYGVLTRRYKISLIILIKINGLQENCFIL